MFQAQMLMANGTAGAGAVYTPWMDKRGDNMIATIEVVALSGGSGITVTVLSKAKSDAGDGTAVGSTFAQTSAGRSSATFTGLNELVRFKFDPGTTNGHWSLFRMLPSSWFDTAKP